MSESSAPPSPISSGHFTTQSLARAMHAGELSSTDIRALPAQSIFMAMKHLGIPASGELVLQASVEQVRLFMDLDCWQKDRFREDAFWEWLSLADEEDGLQVLQKVLKCIDLRLVGLLITKYVHTVTFDEPTEAPPHAGYHTPDNGHSWIGIKVEDETKHFLLARFLALIFETNADLFYQLLSTPSVASESVLEDEAFNDRVKRLSAEGIPDRETAASLHSALSEAEISKLVTEKRTHVGESLSAIEPLVYDARLPRPLATLFEGQTNQEALESELSFIMNGAIVFFGVDIFDLEKVRFLTEQVKGALNIGLERALAKFPSMNALDLYRDVGLAAFYRLGHTHLAALRKLAQKTEQISNLQGSAILESLRNWPPFAPSFAFESIEPGQTEMDTTPRPIMSYNELGTLKALVSGDGAPLRPQSH